MRSFRWKGASRQARIRKGSGLELWDFLWNSGDWGLFAIGLLYAA